MATPGLQHLGSHPAACRYSVHLEKGQHTRGTTTGRHRRRDRLQALAAGIENAGGTALVLEADITDRAQAEAAVQQAAGRFGRLDVLVNSAGLMLLGPVVGADPGA